VLVCGKEQPGPHVGARSALRSCLCSAIEAGGRKLESKGNQLNAVCESCSGWSRPAAAARVAALRISFLRLRAHATCCLYVCRYTQHALRWLRAGSSTTLGCSALGRRARPHTCESSPSAGPLMRVSALCAQMLRCGRALVLVCKASSTSCPVQVQLACTTCFCQPAAHYETRQHGAGGLCSSLQGVQTSKPTSMLRPWPRLTIKHLWV